MTDLEGRSEMSNAQWFINYKQGKRIETSSGYTSEKKAIEEAHKFEREYRLIVISIECENRGGLGCLNSFSASISGASAAVRLPSGVAAG